MPFTFYQNIWRVVYCWDSQRSPHSEGARCAGSPAYSQSALTRKPEPEFDRVDDKLNWWEQWLQQPQRLRVHSSLFQLHYRIGAVAGAYLTLMSITGSMLVFRNELPQWRSIEWLVKLHTNLLAGSIGRWVNGVGGGCLTLLCLTGAIIWWPGVKYWHRSLQVNCRELPTDQLGFV